LKKITTDLFISNAQAIHGDRYDYTNVCYNGAHHNIEIICKEHGSFFQSPKNHISHNRGCPLCGEITKLKKLKDRMITTDQFITEAKIIHGDKYDYSLCTYKNCYTPVQIICSMHGPFLKAPKEHIHKNKSGCMRCAHEAHLGGYSEKFFSNNPDYKNKPATLYIIKGTDKVIDFIKIGITKQSIHKRFKNFNNKFSLSILSVFNMSLYEAYKIEQAALNQFADEQYYIRFTLKFDGRTECFRYSTDIASRLHNFCVDKINTLAY
jgi:hypothetical protein